LEFETYGWDDCFEQRYYVSKTDVIVGLPFWSQLPKKLEKEEVPSTFSQVSGPARANYRHPKGAESATFWILSMKVLVVSFDLEINCIDRWGMMRVAEIIGPFGYRSKTHPLGMRFSLADRYESIQFVARRFSGRLASHAG
jgi:hypothetical protein